MKRHDPRALRNVTTDLVNSNGTVRASLGRTPRTRHSSAPIVLLASRIASLRKRWRRAIPMGTAAVEAVDWAGVEHRLLDDQPSALLLDLRLLNSHGVERLETIKRLRPDVKIIVLTVHPDDPDGIAALRAGVHGYCDRNIAPTLLGKALADALDRKQLWIGRKLTGHLLSELTSLTEQGLTGAREDGEVRFDGLLPREREVALLVGEGATDAEVAELMDVPLRAVRTSVAAILRKLRISSRVQLALVMLGRAGSSSSFASR